VVYICWLQCSFFVCVWFDWLLLLLFGLVCGVFSQVFGCFVLLALCAVIGIGFAFAMFMFVVIVLLVVQVLWTLCGLVLFVGLLWGCCDLYFLLSVWVLH